MVSVAAVGTVHGPITGVGMALASMVIPPFVAAAPYAQPVGAGAALTSVAAYWHDAKHSHCDELLMAHPSAEPLLHYG